MSLHHFELFADYHQIYYSKLDSLSEDELEGDDEYRVVLWPGTATDVTVRKQYNRGS